MDSIEKYNDIINLPQHTSNKHKRMSIEARTAQFAPFAALTGFDNQIKKVNEQINNQ